MLSIEQLLELNRLGYIPGPDEAAEEFEQRVVHCRNNASDIAEPVLTQVEKVFDIRPSWVKVFYSDKKLPSWEGAATWIDGGSVAIQLRSALKKGSYLKLYQRDEIVAHEVAHAARMAFDEPRFEEIIAYQLSENVLRKWGGGLFQRAYESYIFVTLLILGFWLPWLPWLPLLYGIGRLSVNLLLFKRCLKNLSALVGERAMAVAFRLTDREIVAFARLSVGDIMQYIEGLSAKTLRGKVLHLAYFAHCRR